MHSPSTPYAAEVKRIKALGIETGDIARATGAGISTVGSWARSKRQPTAEFRDRFMDLVSIVDRLSSTMDAREPEAERWTPAAEMRIADAATNVVLMNSLFMLVAP